MVRQEALGHRLSHQGHHAETRGEAFVNNHFTLTRRAAFALAASFAFALSLPAPCFAAAKIQHLTSPGGIEAWFVQDSADKPGVGNMVASLIDEGSGDLDSKAYHERLDRRAIELNFSVTRDYFRCSLRMLKDNTDEAFGLLHMALTSSRLEDADVER